MLFVSDLVINGYIYEGKYGLIYDGWYYTYAVMAGIILIGSFLFQKVNVKNILVSSVASTLLFWLVLDFIVWAGGGMNIITGMPLSRDFTGLIQCYAQGLPFAKNFFLGTAVYSTFLFGVYEFSKSKIISFQTA
jgi:ammonia channel protein AmtB